MATLASGITEEATAGAAGTSCGIVLTKPSVNPRACSSRFAKLVVSNSSKLSASLRARTYSQLGKRNLFHLTPRSGSGSTRV